MRKCDQRRFFDLDIGRLRLSVSDVVTNRVVEKNCLLSDERDLFSQAGDRRFSYINTVPQNCAGGRIVKTRQQLCQC